MHALEVQEHCSSHTPHSQGTGPPCMHAGGERQAASAALALHRALQGQLPGELHACMTMDNREGPNSLCECIAAQLVFGGAGMQGTLGDLWLFNTGSRTWIAPVVEGAPPCPREMHSGSMVSDSRLLIYGGRSAKGQARHILKIAAQAVTRTPHRHPLDCVQQLL